MSSEYSNQKPNYSQPHNIHFNTGNKALDAKLTQKEHVAQKHNWPSPLTQSAIHARLKFREKYQRSKRSKRSLDSND